MLFQVAVISYWNLHVVTILAAKGQMFIYYSTGYHQMIASKERRYLHNWMAVWFLEIELEVYLLF